MTAAIVVWILLEYFILIFIHTYRICSNNYYRRHPNLGALSGMHNFSELAILQKIAKLKTRQYLFHTLSHYAEALAIAKFKR